MWDCLNCGCRAIAASLLACPMCQEERSDMPRATVEGGASNAAAEPGETGYHEHPGTGEELTGTGHPADGTTSPEVSNPAGETQGKPANPKTAPPATSTPPKAAGAATASTAPAAKS
jgi:hypothetical protein